jgi:diguanylate cyclase (GGDEF)-like protein
VPHPEIEYQLPVVPFVAVLVATVVANLALMVIVGALFVRDSRRRLGVVGGDGQASSAIAQDLAKSEIDYEDWTLVDGVPTADYERVVRMASFLFILTAATVVVATGLWADHELAILVVLAIAGLSVLTIHDLLSPGFLGAARFIVEGPLAITLVALLVAFTGREWSPFFFAFPLIVAGAALVVEGPVTLLLAIGAGIGYLAAVFIRPPEVPLSPTAVAGVALNLAALLLLAFVASVVARAQRHSRLEAIRLSTVDSLTGLFNRSYFFAALEREIQRSARSGRGFCLLMMDLDGLKAINDRFGHFNGDRALRTVGETIRARVRRIDTAARYGGDEFVVVLPETEPAGAFVLAEKIRVGVGERSVKVDGLEVRTSLSIGVVVYPRDGRTVDDLMIAADTTMYRSKRQGRDRVVGSWVANGGGIGATAMATGSDVGPEAGAGPARSTIGAGPVIIGVAPAPVGAAGHVSDPVVGEGRPKSV